MLPNVYYKKYRCSIINDETLHTRGGWYGPKETPRGGSPRRPCTPGHARTEAPGWPSTRRGVDDGQWAAPADAGCPAGPLSRSAGEADRPQGQPGHDRPAGVSALCGVARHQACSRQRGVADGMVAHNWDGRAEQQGRWTIVAQNRRADSMALSRQEYQQSTHFLFKRRENIVGVELLST